MYTIRLRKKPGYTSTTILELPQLSRALLNASINTFAPTYTATPKASKIKHRRSKKQRAFCLHRCSLAAPRATSWKEAEIALGPGAPSVGNARKLKQITFFSSCFPSYDLLLTQASTNTHRRRLTFVPASCNRCAAVKPSARNPEALCSHFGHPRSTRIKRSTSVWFGTLPPPDWIRVCLCTLRGGKKGKRGKG